MAGPLTWQFAEDYAARVGPVALLTGHPDTLAKGSQPGILLAAAAPHNKGNYLLRTFSWVTYFAQAVRWIWRWPRTTPILLFSTPPILLWLGLLCRVFRQQRFAIMVHDIYPDLLVGLGKMERTGAVARVWRALNRHAYERAELVMTLGPHMAETLRKSFDPAQTSCGQIECIAPWADTSAIRPLEKEGNWFAQKFGQVGKFTVIYSGNMGMSHDIEMMLAAAERLQDDPGIHFLFIGSGPKRVTVEAAINEKRLNNMTLLPWQPEEVLPFSLTCGDVAIVSLKQELAGLVLPSKAWSFMAAGVPLLVVAADRGELADLAARYPLGWRVRPGDIDAMCELLGRLSKNGELHPAREASRLAAEEVGSRRNSEAMTRLVAEALGPVAQIGPGNVQRTHPCNLL